MPAGAIERDIRFTNAPFAATSEATDKARICIPAQFDTTQQNFSVVIFLHGSVAQFVREKQLSAATRQFMTGRPNVLLVAPRFEDFKVGKFQVSGGFGNFVDELQLALAKVLLDAGVDQAQAQAIGRHAAKEAPLVLAAYSAGHLAVRAIYKEISDLPAGQEKTTWTARLKRLFLLDALFGAKDGNGVVKSSAAKEIGQWMDNQGAASVLVSLYGKDTPQFAKESNSCLISRLPAVMRPTLSMAWPSEATPWTAPSASFVEVTTGHFQLLADGPPQGPIAAFVSRL